jgi:glycosyltransferase involved in cell wall biosynthesis
MAMSEPLISAIMPARGRPEMTAAAVDCWKSQIWPNSELLILDDADCPAFPAEAAKAAKFCPGNRWEAAETAILGATAGQGALLASNWPDSTCPAGDGSNGRKIAYFCLPKRLTVGAKRNLGCCLAHGEFVAHFDSDDYSASDRLEDQYNRLTNGGTAVVTGYHSMLFTDGGQWWRYDGPVFKDCYGAFGTSLVYRRDWWAVHQFIDGPKNRTDSEDNPFIRSAMMAGRFIGSPAGEMMVARVHRDNTSPKCTTGSRYVSVPMPTHFQGVLEPWMRIAA